MVTFGGDEKEKERERDSGQYMEVVRLNSMGISVTNVYHRTFDINIALF